jgi:cytochrome P450
MQSTATGTLPASLPLPSTLQTLLFWREPLKFLTLCHSRYGESFTVYPIGKPPFVLLSEPADIKAIMTASPDVLHPGAGATVISPVVGDGSFMLLEGDRHMEGRKAILPAFGRQAVEEHRQTLDRIVADELAGWPVDVPIATHALARALTLKIILLMVFGRWDESLATLHKRLLTMLSAMPTLALQEPFLRRVPGWRHTWKRFLEERAAVDALLFRCVEVRQLDEGRSSDMLALLLAASREDGSRRFSPEQMRDNIMLAIVAGHETTSSQLAWAFEMLARHPTIRSRLAREIERDVSTDYLEATITEVLRHRPVFPFIVPREVRQSIELGGHTYKPPTHLLGCIYLMHHNPKIYRVPHEFDPARFLEERPRPDTWLPWGGGRRRCLGHRLAVLEMLSVLRTALLLWDVLPGRKVAERACWRGTILTPHAGGRVILRKRH